MPTKDELQDKINAMSHDMLRMEIALVDQRKRSADLYNALSVDCPEAAARLTPEATRGSQFNRIWNLVNACYNADPYWEQSQHLEDVIDATQDLKNYYSDHFENRRVLSDEHLAKLAEGRERARNAS